MPPTAVASLGPLNGGFECKVWVVCDGGFVWVAVKQVVVKEKGG